MDLPITERSNPLTRNLDIVDPVGIVRMLRQSDLQIFSGWEDYPSILDEEMIEQTAHFAWRLSRFIGQSDARIIVSGAGTSGRLAWHYCLEFNRLLREEKQPEIFVPLIAGGEPALVNSQESAEDNTAAAVKELKALIPEELKRGMYIGISAGLSAPWVGAQLDLIGGDERFQSVLMGFNPAHHARKGKVEGWDSTMYEVVERALKSERFLLLNPIYGPEAITGSTRMKGGTVTKMLLEIGFVTALEILKNQIPHEQKEELNEENLFPLRARILERLYAYGATIRAVYQNIPALADLVRLGGTSLRSDGRMFFLGRGPAGIHAVFDCAECPPTFGADPFDVRGFILEGWECLGCNPQAMWNRGKAYEISHEKFEEDYLPDVSRGDYVMGAAISNVGDNSRRLIEVSQQARASTALLLVTADGGRSANVPEDLRCFALVEVPSLGFLPGWNNLAEMALKVCLNIVSTGSHTMSGKIYQNQLIDLRISNSKLYNRAIGLIGRLAGVSEEAARKALFQAIFKSVPTEEELGEASVSVAVQRAAGRSRVVPLAVLLATKRFTYQEAYDRLMTEPRVRRIIEQELQSSEENATAEAGASGS